LLKSKQNDPTLSDISKITLNCINKDLTNFHSEIKIIFQREKIQSQHFLQSFAKHIFFYVFQRELLPKPSNLSFTNNIQDRQIKRKNLSGKEFQEKEK